MVVQRLVRRPVLQGRSASDNGLCKIEGRMLLAKKIFLGVGFAMGFVGFLIAALSDYRSLGIGVFIVGFFIGCIAIVTLIFSVPTDIFGRKTGPGIKIAALGFGIAALGQLIEFSFQLNSSISDVSFGIGSLVMIVGILSAIFKIARQ